MRRLLFCHAPFGSGHTMAKVALEEALRQEDIAIVCHSIDVFSYLPNRLMQMLLKGYRLMLNHMPSVYRRLYRLGEKSSVSLGMRLLLRYLQKRVQKELCDYRPDAIVCTHATPTMLAAMLREAGMIDVPIIAVVTDYTLHRLWIHPQVDRYFVAHDALKSKLIAQGIAKERIIVSGIPIRRCFCSGKKRHGAKQVLVMGGGWGLIDLPAIMGAVIRLDKSPEVKIIAGSEEGRSKLCRALRGYSHHIKVEGYCQNVDEAMSRATVLITKAGGVTVAEAMAMRVPLILFGSLPGQEEANEAYLREVGAALVASNEEELARLIAVLLENRDKQCERMIRRQEQLSKRNSANIIVKDIIARIAK